MGKRTFLVTFDAALEPHEVRLVTADGIRRALWREEVPHAPEACIQVQEICDCGMPVTANHREVAHG